MRTVKLRPLYLQKLLNSIALHSSNGKLFVNEFRFVYHSLCTTVCRDSGRSKLYGKVLILAITKLQYLFTERKLFVSSIQQ